MLNDLQLIEYSLELNLYQGKIMMEHEMFLLSFLPNNEQEYTSIFKQGIKNYQDLLKKLIVFADGRVSQKFIDSKQLVTDYTLSIEKKTMKYFNIGINLDITEQLAKLKSGHIDVTKEELELVNNLNKKMYGLVSNSLSNLKKLDILIKNGSIFLTIYPLTIDHLIKETTVFQKELKRLLNKEDIDPTYVYNYDYFYTDIMKEHGLFIRGLTNPVNESCITKATKFVSLYQNILDLFNNDISPYTIKKINEECQKVTYGFGDFNEMLTSEVLNNNFYFMILPLFIDHLLRESYNFISHLAYYENK